MPEYGVRIPANIDREDKILAGLTARQVVILAVTGLVIWSVYLVVGARVPLPVFGVFALTVATAGAGLALGSREGLSADRFVLAAWRYTRTPRRQVLAPEGIPDTPTWAQQGPAQPLGPLALAARSVHPDGVIDLADQGVAVIAEASTVGFALRAPQEQRALVTAFARWLNSLTAPVQIVVRSEWVDLGPLIADLQEAAPGLADPALERAARDHAAFLTALSQDSDLLRRQVLLVLHEPHSGRDRQTAGDQVLGRVDAASRALAAAEITVTALDGGQAAAVLAAATNPFAPPHPAEGWAAPDQVVTGRTP